jgi:hypothetical protein
MFYTAELIKYAANVKKLTKSREGFRGAASLVWSGGLNCARGLAVLRGYPVRTRYLETPHLGP